MTDDEWHGLAATARPEEALQIPTAIDEKDLANARLDDRWREFCLNAERYVVETTRRRSQRSGRTSLAEGELRERRSLRGIGRVVSVDERRREVAVAHPLHERSKRRRRLIVSGATRNSWPRCLVPRPDWPVPAGFEPATFGYEH